MARVYRRVCHGGCLYRVVGEMPYEQGAYQMAEAYKRQTGATDVGYSVDPKDSKNYIVTVKDSNQNITVKCNLCKCQFNLPYTTAVTLTKNNDGFIPCEKCGSHATQWTLDLTE